MIVWRFVATFFYLGKLPFAPGSCGSLGALLLWFFIPLTFSVHLSFLIILFVLGVYSSNKIAENLDDHDPPEVVIDEVVGMGISLFMLPQSFELYFLAFILFRIFDIFKPLFIYRIQNLSGGWGIMLDDVLAGLFTLILVKGITLIL